MKLILIKLKNKLRFLINSLKSRGFFLRDGDTYQVLKIVQKFLPENPNIMEAGAFNGSDTIKINKFWPKAKIFAFEPVPENFNRLVDITKYLGNVFCYKLALSNKDGFLKFYNSYSSKKPDKPASGSLLPPKEHLTFAPHVKFNEIIEVESMTLDSWAVKNKIDHIDFLWLDMQGMELNVIMNAPNIMKTVKVIYTEVEFIEAYENQYQYKDIKKYLEEQGFKLIARNFTDNQIINPQISKKWFGDAIFVKSNLI